MMNFTLSKCQLPVILSKRTFWKYSCRNICLQKNFGGKFNRSFVFSDSVNRVVAPVTGDICRVKNHQASHKPGFIDENYDKLDPSFQNVKEAFLSKSSLELLRAMLVFNMCSVKVLVEKNKEVSVTAFRIKYLI